jgi:hypothetical protein
MFGRRRRDRERGRRIGAAVSKYMDDLETQDWRRKQEGPVLRDDETGAAIIAGHVEHLLVLVEQDRETLMDALGKWNESRERRHADDDERIGHITGTYLAFGVTGVGNLFGYIPPDAPAFRPELAAEGRRRGWRND